MDLATGKGIEAMQTNATSSTTATSPSTIEMNATVPSSIKDQQMDVCIMVAVRCGHVSVLQCIHKELPNYSFSFPHTSHETDNNQFTPLLHACKYNQKEVLEWLLPRVKKHDKTRDKETALILAVRHKEVNLEVIRSLLKNGDQNLGDKDKHKMTALHIACSNGCKDVVKLLLYYNNAWSAQGKTAPKILGRNELRNKDGNTPFMLAVSQNTESHREIVQMWLEMEQEPSMILRPVCEDVNKKGFNAVMIAACSGQLECLKIMEESNAVTDGISAMTTKSGWNIIHCAIASGCLETVKWLLTRKASVLKTTEILDVPNKKGYTPFLLACEYHHAEVVKYFIQLAQEDGIGININAKTENGMTGLHLATMHDAREIVDVLLEYKIDILAQEEEHGNTVLHIATSKSSMRVENRLKKEDKYEQLKAVENYNKKTAEDVRNPVHIPLEIRKRGDKSIDAYLKALREGKTKNNHCNLIVLGEERVGKTSLIKSLLGMDFDPNCESTRGVHLVQVQTAEFVEIVVPVVEVNDMPEVWKTAISPQKRVSEQITDSVAKAVTEADPKHPKKLSEEIKTKKSEGDLLIEVIQIIKRLKPPPEQHKPHPLRKKSHPPPPQTKFDNPLKPFMPPLPLKHDRPLPMSQPPKPFQRTLHPPKLFASPQILTEEPVKVVQPSRDLAVDVVHSKAPRTRESISYEDSTAVAKKLKQNKKNEQDKILFHAVDFAGQSLYRLMHHCFITNRAVYLVVFKLTDLLKHIRKETPNKDPVIEIRYWLNNIIAHASIGNTEDTDHPKIFLVGTHKNGENGVAVSREDLKDINQHLLEVFIGGMDEKRYENSFQWCHDEGEEVVFSIENSITNCQRAESGINQLMSSIRVSSKQMPFIKEDFPISYMRFEKKLFEMQEERKNEPLTTTRKEVEEWAKECGISDDEGVNTAIQFFHDIRVIVDQTLISSPFKQQEPSLNDPIVLLSPQWLGNVMRMIVELKLGNKDLPIRGSKSLNMLGIIHKEDLLSYLSSKISCLPEKNSHANLLEVLELYCLIYPLSVLHCRLLGIKQNDGHLVKENYLIPVKLPELKSSNELSLIGEHYSFEFDFQSYLPEEVYLYTICYFLSLMTELQDEFETDYVTLSKLCSRFMFVRLGNLPKAHWTVQVNKSTQTLVFNTLPLDKVEFPSQFVVEVAELILNRVCINSSLGYLEYKGGPRTKCRHSRKEVLLPVVSRSNAYRNLRVAQDGEVYCPDCRRDKINTNTVLSKMIQTKTSNFPHCSTVLAPGPLLSGGEQQPTAAELDLKLEELVEWKHFAMHLRKIECHHIATIEKEKNTVGDQKIQLYNKWLSVCPDASWSDVITALKKAQEATLAARVIHALNQ